jgi:hypothetical protein
MVQNTQVKKGKLVATMTVQDFDKQEANSSSNSSSSLFAAAYHLPARAYIENRRDFSGLLQVTSTVKKKTEDP